MTLFGAVDIARVGLTAICHVVSHHCGASGDEAEEGIDEPGKVGRGAIGASECGHGNDCEDDQAPDLRSLENRLF